jgi:hypothetical protein
MSTKQAWDEGGEEPRVEQAKGWRELYLKEDWWAIVLGIALRALPQLAGLPGVGVQGAYGARLGALVGAGR